MKFLSKARAGLRKNLISNKSGQGATEYILLLVVIVGLVVAFKDPIMKAVKGKTDKLGTSIDDFSAQ